MAAPIRVLIVDDERDYLEPISFWFRTKGYDVSTAESGRDAIAQVRAHAPDIVFMDVNMPGMSGIEALRTIRTFNAQLPVIIVTAAYQSEETFTDARALGIAGFFPKQSGMDELARLLEVTLRTHGKLRAQAPPESPA
ncbi:MAG TPA: response regulator [bacterium]